MSRRRHEAFALPEVGRGLLRVRLGSDPGAAPAEALRLLKARQRLRRPCSTVRAAGLDGEERQ